jgi:hypothetical protein
MPFFKFTEDFRFKLRPGAYRQYRAGREINVTTACAEAAIADGAGYVVSKPQGVRISKRGKPIEPEVTQAFIREEAPAEEEARNGDDEGSQPYLA